ncbi:ribosome recycling factor [bacterium]|nr:ribosome recycling factor [bacterium]
MYNFNSFKTDTQSALGTIKEDIGSLRTGGASPQLLDSVRVEAYGTQMKVTELAAITATDPTMLVVSPWDKSVLSAIEKGIQQAGINLNPVVDGDIIRISVPPLTEESRQQLVKTLHQKIEDGKVMLRGLRASTKQAIEAQKGQAGVSEDNIKTDLQTLEDEMKKLMTQVDELEEKKRQELTKV